MASETFSGSSPPARAKMFFRLSSCQMAGSRSLSTFTSHNTCCPKLKSSKISGGEKRPPSRPEDPIVFAFQVANGRSIESYTCATSSAYFFTHSTISLRDWSLKTPTARVFDGIFDRNSAKISDRILRGLSAKMNPSASAPARIASCASWAFVIPQIFICGFRPVRCRAVSLKARSSEAGSAARKKCSPINAALYFSSITSLSNAASLIPLSAIKKQSSGNKPRSRRNFPVSIFRVSRSRELTPIYLTGWLSFWTSVSSVISIIAFNFKSSASWVSSLSWRAFKRRAMSNMKSAPAFFASKIW